MKMIRSVLMFSVLSGILGGGLCLRENGTDSVAAAITVYKNPDFFRNTTADEDLGAGEEEKEDAEEFDDEVNENIFDAEKENFYDFDDVYLNHGELNMPNPPVAPDIPDFFGESEEFQQNSRDAASSYRDSGKEGRRNSYGMLSSGTEDDSEHFHQGGFGKDLDEETSYEAEEIPAEKHISSSGNSYHMHLDEDLYPRMKHELYEKSKKYYYDPVFGGKMKAFSYPPDEDLDYYPIAKKLEDKKAMKRTVYTDRKKGTREYYKDHELEEVLDIPKTGSVKSGTKHVFRTVSKIGIKALKPILLQPHAAPKFRTKIKLAYWPVKRVKVRIGRQVPDDSVYELNSDYDSEYEFLSSS